MVTRKNILPRENDENGENIEWRDGSKKISSAHLLAVRRHV